MCRRKKTAATEHRRTALQRAGYAAFTHQLQVAAAARAMLLRILNRQLAAAWAAWRAAVEESRRRQAAATEAGG